jgi:hypothetical protein
MRRTKDLSPKQRKEREMLRRKLIAKAPSEIKRLLNQNKCNQAKKLQQKMKIIDLKTALNLKNQIMNKCKE